MNMLPPRGHRSPQPYHFFIIHAGRDIELATALHRSFARVAPQANVFLASESIEPGACWPYAIRDAMARTQVFVVLVSSALDQAHYAQSEIASAIAYMRCNHGTRIVPLFLDGVAPQCAYGLANLQGLHMGEGDTTDDIATAMVGSLRPIVDPLNATACNHLLGIDWRGPRPPRLDPRRDHRRYLPAILAPLGSSSSSTGAVVGLASTIAALVATTTVLGIDALHREPRGTPIDSPTPVVDPPRPAPHARAPATSSPEPEPELVLIDEPEGPEPLVETPSSPSRFTRAPVQTPRVKVHVDPPHSPAPETTASEYRTYNCLVGPDDEWRTEKIATNQKGQCTPSDRRAFLHDEGPGKP